MEKVNCLRANPLPSDHIHSTCRKRADALHGKNSSFKFQVINCFNAFVTIITSKIMTD